MEIGVKMNGKPQFIIHKKKLFRTSDIDEVTMKEISTEMSAKPKHKILDMMIYVSIADGARLRRSIKNALAEIGENMDNMLRSITGQAPEATGEKTFTTDQIFEKIRKH